MRKTRVIQGVEQKETNLSRLNIGRYGKLILSYLPFLDARNGFVSLHRQQGRRRCSIYTADHELERGVRRNERNR